MRRVPGHLLVQPDQQRPALAGRSVLGGPVRRAVTGGLGLAHAIRLTAWIRDANASRREFCNNGHPEIKEFHMLRPEPRATAVRLHVDIHDAAWHKIAIRGCCRKIVA